VIRPAPISASTIDELFQTAAKKRKAEFSIELAAVFADRASSGQAVSVPALVGDMFEWLSEEPADSAGHGSDNEGENALATD
jgi:hypothetical protein